MGKKDDKLRKALGKLFKLRGEHVETAEQKKPTKKDKKSNGESKDNGKSQHGYEELPIQCEKKEKPKRQNKFDKKQAKKATVLTTESKLSQKSNGNSKPANKNKKAFDTEKYGSESQEPKPKKSKKKQKNETNENGTKKPKKNKKMAHEETEAVLPRGYFVMNHGEKTTECDSKIEAGNNKNNKKKNSSAAKETNGDAKTKKNKKIERQQSKKSKKRKAIKDNGPQTKLFKPQSDIFDGGNDSEQSSGDEFKKFSSLFAHRGGETDESSYASLTDETDSSFSDSYDGYESFEDSYDDDDKQKYGDDDIIFDSDDLDDTYSEHSASASDIYVSDSESLNSIHDPDYELPKTVLQDHIVHKGLAVKHDVTAELDIQFDELDESAQVIELPSSVAQVEQHVSLNPEHLRTLELKFVEKITLSSTADSQKTFKAKETTETGDCPDLVPIDDVNFRLWTSGIEMDDEIFSENSDGEFIESDEESITAAEGNINDKYLKNDESSAESDEASNESCDDEEDTSTSFVPKKILDIRADVLRTYDCNFDAFNFKSHNPAEKEKELSLSEIITRTHALFDPKDVVIKTAVVNVFESSQDSTPGAAEEMRSNCLQSPEEQQAEYSNEIMLESPNSVESPMDLELLNESVADESMASTSENLPAYKFKSFFFDSINSHQVLVLLKSAFYIYGTIEATLIAGAAEVFGYKLQKLQTHKLYSPRGVCALQIIPSMRSLNDRESPSNSKEEILATIGTFSTECDFHDHDLAELVKNFVPKTDAILLLARNEDAYNLKRMMQLHVKENIFPAQIPQSRQFYSSEYLLDCMINVNTEYPLHIPPQWQKLRMKSNSKFLLAGGKSVGKSTLLRFLVNQHLNKFPTVLVLDLDIGQPEIFVSQAVSCALIQQPLLGPGFFQNIQPDKAYCVAHSNVVLCAHRYMPAVVHLLEYCSQEPRYRDIPWIVNTMGYNKGFGAELIAVISEHLRPTDLVQLQSNVPINNFDFFFEPHTIPTIERNIFNRSEYVPTNNSPLNYRLHVLPSAVLQQGRYQREWQMSAKDMRYVMLLTQLSRLLNERSEILNQKHTYSVSLDAIRVTSPLTMNAKPLDVARSLVSNLVYLGHSDAGCTHMDTIECLGIGIVRAIDWPQRKLHLLTSLSMERLKKVNTLTAGDMSLPASMLTLQNLGVNSNVPFVQNVADEAASRSVRQFYSRT